MRNSTRSDRPAASVPAQDSPSTGLSRRRFLFTLGAGGAGAAVVASASGAVAATAATAQSTDTDAAYRETVHVRDYYRTTKI